MKTHTTNGGSSSIRVAASPQEAGCRKSAGFTCLELLVVLGVLALLISMVISARLAPDPVDKPSNA